MQAPTLPKGFVIRQLPMLSEANCASAWCKNLTDVKPASLFFNGHPPRVGETPIAGKLLKQDSE